MDCLVTGLGASASVLEALGAFWDAVPEDLTVSLVVTLHEDPKHESYPRSLRQKRTIMPEDRIQDGDRSQMRQMHICPPGRLLALEKGRFRVKEINGQGVLATVDYVFHSPVLEMETECAVVVLSGTGSDGAKGVRDIKQGGGLVMVQDEDTAAYAGMPQATRGTRAADFVLPPMRCRPPWPATSATPNFWGRSSRRRPASMALPRSMTSPASATGRWCSTPGCWMTTPGARPASFCPWRSPETREGKSKPDVQTRP